MSNVFSSHLVDLIKRQALSDEYAAYCRNLLQELIEIDTTPNADPAEMAAREERIFAIIDNELRGLCGDDVALERVPIDPAIASDPNYSQPYYTITADRPLPLPAAEAYAHRHNLVALFKGAAPGTAGRPAIYNAHVDTVAGWIKPRSDGHRIYGRGACDDKAQIVLLLAQIRLLNELRVQSGLRCSHDRAYQFVIDEEMGGNGALSMARDPRFAGWEVVVHEITNNIPHPANRGAMWYRCSLSGAGSPEARPVEMWPFVVHALEAEGARIKAESNHPLFRPDHVQTSHGILGCCGKHPSAVNDHVAIKIEARASANPERISMRITEVLDAALAEYTRTYGDKRKEIDAVSGQPKVAQHYKLTFEPSRDALGWRLDVYGKSGHMGAITQCDCAITKAAFMLIALMRVARNYPGVQARGYLADARDMVDPIVLEGGQGFQPTHPMEQLRQRLTEAARLGVRHYCDFRSVPYSDAMVSMTFEKLHNEAYASPPDCPAMKAFQRAYGALGLAWPEPAAWRVSCDARLFSLAGHNVVTFGPGELLQAHSADESIDIRQIQQGLAISVLQAADLGGLK
jgi:acetylornithine deacetylase/succinyl-diaminopimelate desuccinylase-like protein